MEHSTNTSSHTPSTPSTPNFSLIIACDSQYGIGKNNQLPWRLPSELKYFHDKTQNSTVIMGRKTWESLPPSSKPLKNRQNIVLTSQKDFPLPPGAEAAAALAAALELASRPEVFVIGGAGLFAESIPMESCKTIYLTEIDGNFGCDVFFPTEDFHQNFELTSSSDLQEENGIQYKFNVYSRKTN